MMLTFKNFKKTIPPTILARGRQYYNDGAVVDLSPEDEDTWLAVVQGTDAYDVHITLDQGDQLTCTCTCPYEYGEHCKHVAAVLYAIEEAFPEQFAGKTQRTRGPKKRTKLEKLVEALESTPPEKLRAALLDLARTDRHLLNQLLIRFDVTGGKPADYRAMVKQALRAGRREYGFIDYQGARQAAAQLTILLTQADRLMEEGSVNRAVALYQTILEETVDVYGNADDSSGALGDCIAQAVDGLQEALPRLLPPERQELFSYFLQQAQRPHLMDFDWGWEMFDAAAGMIDNQTDRDRLFAALDSLAQVDNAGQDDNFSRNYRAERAALYKLDVIRRFDGETAAFHFMQSEAHHDRFRQLLIQEYVNRENYTEAVALAREGINLNKERRYPGLVNQYRELLLGIAERLGDKPTAAALTRQLWLNSRDTRFFLMLKHQTPSEEWPALREKLIQENPHGPSILAWVFASEEMWDRLLALVMPDKIQLLETHRKELEARFPNEVALIYERAVQKMLEPVTNRATYQDAAGLLQRMKALGQGARAREIADSFIRQYPQRRAMVEELRRV